MTKPLGTQWIVELYGCEAGVLERVPWIERSLLEAARAAHANVVSHSFHQFKPYGVSGVVVIEESHLTIHTWPEHGYAAVDMFFCSEVDAAAAVDVLKHRLRPAQTDCRTLHRGAHAQPGLEAAS